jgi:hypothetical protein
MSRGKSFLAVLCSATLLLTLNVDIASAAVKAGDACPKLKSTSTVKGIKYTCIKSGNKLVWNKGVKVAAKPTSKPTPAATPVPAPVVLATPGPVVSPTPTPTSAASLELFRKAAIANNTYYAAIDGCHVRETSAELQFSIDGNWKFLAGAMGWIEATNCPATHPVQPWVAVDVPERTTLRWRFWVPGSFDLNSTNFTSLVKKASVSTTTSTSVTTTTTVTPPNADARKKKQTLTFLQPNDMTVGDTQELSISLSSGLIPNSSIKDTTICNFAKQNSVIALKVGVCEYSVSHPGNSEFSESNLELRTIVIRPKQLVTPTPTPTPVATPSPTPTPSRVATPNDSTCSSENFIGKTSIQRVKDSEVKVNAVMRACSYEIYLISNGARVNGAGISNIRTSTDFVVEARFFAVTCENSYVARIGVWTKLDGQGVFRLFPVPGQVFPSCTSAPAVTPAPVVTPAPAPVVTPAPAPVVTPAPAPDRTSVV